MVPRGTTNDRGSHLPISKKQDVGNILWQKNSCVFLGELNEETKERKTLRYPYYETNQDNNSHYSQMDEANEDENSYDDQMDEEDHEELEYPYKSQIVNSHLYKRGATKY